MMVATAKSLKYWRFDSGRCPECERGGLVMVKTDGGSYVACESCGDYVVSEVNWALGLSAHDGVEGDSVQHASEFWSCPECGSHSLALTGQDRGRTMLFVRCTQLSSRFVSDKRGARFVGKLLASCDYAGGAITRVQLKAKYPGFEFDWVDEGMDDLLRSVS